MKIFSSEQLNQADKITTEKQQISSNDLMERAGTQVFNWLHHRMQGAQVPIHIFCGIGNNGGDGLVVGRLLIENGYNVNMFVVNCSDKRSSDFLTNYDRIKNVTKSWPLLMTSENDFPEIEEEDIIIDAIFGIGLNRCLDTWVLKLVQYLNSLKSFKLAIDMPSGLYANAPQEDLDAVLNANHTLTFQAPKLSFFLPETGKLVPYFEVLDVGLDAEYLFKTEPLANLIAKPEAQSYYKQREKFTHKGDYGHTLIIGGSYGKMGAAVLAARSAFRAGAGLVSCFVPKCGYTILQTALPEAMVITDENEASITSISVDFEPKVIGIGMGIGTASETIAALEKLLKKTKSPMVLDADALNCISQRTSLLKIIPKNSILTPHLGELERLIGKWKNDYDRLEKVKEFSSKYEFIVVIKGANSMVVNYDKLYINTSGNPGMSTAGSGDVLSGVICGLLSQGYEPLIAAVFGVYLHGSAGNLITQEMGFEALMASDISNYLGKAYLALFEQEPAPIEETE
ncbi:MAG: hydroxyethylthiazole kinase-like uncharacterized protein yjeF [Ulvibacter sp.]|jgi:hydroxyethylthiazole kinase-like uncharacterized protein yjeF